MITLLMLLNLQRILKIINSRNKWKLKKLKNKLIYNL